MNTLETILGLLAKWPAWKRITNAPQEIEALRQRVEMLEAALREKPIGRDECPRCHSLSWSISGNRRDEDFGDMGVSYDQWICSHCGYKKEVEAR